MLVVDAFSSVIQAMNTADLVVILGGMTSQLHIVVSKP
jgi:hypothetical protein